MKSLGIITKTYLFLAVFGIQLVSFEVFPSPTPSPKNSKCSTSARSQTNADREITNLEDLIAAFASGFTPDLKNYDHHIAFEIYRKLKLGNPKTAIDRNSLQRIAETFKKYPNLVQEQTRFRNMLLLSANSKSAEIPEDLNSFSQKIFKRLGKIRSNLFQIESNLGYWMKLTHFEEWNTKSSENKIDLKNSFNKFLDQVYPSSQRTMLVDENTSMEIRALNLAQAMLKIKSYLREHQVSTQEIDLAIFDLIENYPYLIPEIRNGLKSKDIQKMLAALVFSKQKRDELSQDLGIGSNFSEAIEQHFGVDKIRAKNYEQHIQMITHLTNKYSKANAMLDKQNARSIRHLSILEAPFRSCLGGDCSSRTYLTKALDPNYHYFTFTDSNSRSSGHVTIVLGTANQGRKKVAFIDKVQNISNEDLPIMLEGIRRSVLEQGYILAIPRHLGGHNGISNYPTTTDFIATSIPLNKKTPLRKYRPHKNSYKFSKGHSRAYDSLDLYPVIEHKLPPKLQMIEGEVDFLWTTKSFELSNIHKYLDSLLKSDTKNRLKFLPMAMDMERGGFKLKYDLEQIMKEWGADPNQPITIIKQIVLYYWLQKEQALSVVLMGINPRYHSMIVQNLLDTPRYRKKILESPFSQKQIPYLLAFLRNNRKVRNQLLEAYDSPNKDLIHLALESDLFAPHRLTTFINDLKANTPPKSLVDLLKSFKNLLDPQISTEIYQKSLNEFLNISISEASFSQVLFSMLNSKNSQTRKILRDLLLLETPSVKYGDLFEIYKELFVTHRESRNSHAKYSFMEWFANDSIDAKRKADLLLSLVGYGENLFDLFIEKVPAHQQQLLWDRISSKSNLKFFIKRAEEKSLRDYLLSYAAAESFLFVDEMSPQINSPKGFYMGSREAFTKVTLTKSFAIAATNLTQIQYFLINDKIYESAKPDPQKKITHEFIYKGRQGSSLISSSINLPVHGLTRKEALNFVKKLNSMSSEFEYNLPTEAQWEFAARANSKMTDYIFGNDPKHLDEYVWHQQNTNRVHTVAKLKPNAIGLYDIQGNVSDWTLDTLADLPRNDQVDYFHSKRYRSGVHRGGSIGTHISRIKLDQRYFVGENYVGIRLVRRLRNAE